MKKNLFFSMLFLLSLLLLASISEAAAPCGRVNANAAACLSYARGQENKPSVACCNGLKRLARCVKSVNDKKSICRCLNVAAKSSGVQDRYLSKIPGLCGINVGFAVPTSTNCETISLSYSGVVEVRQPLV